jgi:hypothetical protein
VTSIGFARHAHRGVARARACKSGLELAVERDGELTARANSISSTMGGRQIVGMTNEKRYAQLAKRSFARVV